MKYTTRLTIARPCSAVIERFTDSRQYGAWMESLVSMEVLEGEPGVVGTRTRLTHKMGKREVVMTETITHRENPSRLVATYEADGVWNQAINHFEADEDGNTRWVMETEFKCTGIMWLMTTLMPGMFKKQTQKTMEAFQSYIEGQAAGE